MNQTIERKLAAIMFTDIAGYTESMSKSESKSLDTLEKKRSILKPLLKEYKGTFVKEIGDGTLSYFESAVNVDNLAKGNGLCVVVCRLAALSASLLVPFCADVGTP